MRFLAIVIALLCVATGAEARQRIHHRIHHAQRVQHAQPRHVVRQAPQPAMEQSLSIFGAGLQSRQEPQKVIPVRHPAPRMLARHSHRHWRVAAVYQPRWRRIPIIDPPPRHRKSIRYTRHVALAPEVNPETSTKSPALFAISKVTARTLGVTDHSLLFGPVPQTAVSHFSPAAPWAGALVF